MLAALLVSHSAFSQSDYGWFTGKAAAVWAPCGKVGVSYHHIYNLIDQIGVGTGLALMPRDTECGVLMPVTAALRVGMCRRSASTLMPVAYAVCGYAMFGGADAGFYHEARIGLETTRLRRIRWAFFAGAYRLRNCDAHLAIGAGLLF